MPFVVFKYDNTHIQTLEAPREFARPPKRCPTRQGEEMLEEVSEIIGIQVYTNKGTFLGNVSNVILDIENRTVESLFITDTNPLLVEDSRNVAVPYRWVSSVGDIILLRFFPKRVSIRKATPPPQAPPEDFEVVG